MKKTKTTTTTTTTTTLKKKKKKTMTKKKMNTTKTTTITNSTTKTKSTNNNNNSNSKPLYGYLVSQFVNDVKSQRRLQDGWELAKEAEIRFGIKHLLRGPPYHNVGDFGEQLAEKLNRIGRRKKKRYLAYDTDNTTTSSSNQSFPIIINSIQPVEILPPKPTTILYGTETPWKRQNLRTMMTLLSDEIVANFHHHNNTFNNNTYHHTTNNNNTAAAAAASEEQPTGPIRQHWTKKMMNKRDLDKEDIELMTSKISYKEFESNILQGYYATVTLMTRTDDPKWQSFLIDFQVLFDFRYGYMYHLDFDRAFDTVYMTPSNYDPVVRQRKAVADLNEVIQLVLEWKKRMLNIGDKYSHNGTKLSETFATNY